MEKNTTSINRKVVELKCFIKEKEDRIALNKGPTISPARKGGKARNQEAKLKDSAVSHQGNQGLNVPKEHEVCFSVAFFNALLKEGKTELLSTRVLQFLP